MTRRRAMAGLAKYPRHRVVGGIVLATIIVIAAALLPMARQKQAPTPADAATAPVWVYGHARARYTLIEYADLECPYCKAYFPVLKAWIDAHPNVNWQWQHRPLAIHEPAATRDARLAECVGRTHGNEAFWRAVAWIYANSRGNGEGLPASAVFQETSPKLEACLDNPDVGKAVQAQAETASRAGIEATPTLKLVDHSSGKAIVLEGTIEGDALLSAMDWLADASRISTPPSSATVGPQTRSARSSDDP